MNFSLSLIIPVHNEEQAINESIPKIHNYLKNLAIDFEIIISNNGSNDNTFLISENLAAKYENIKLLSSEKRGLGIGIRQGIEHASKDFLMFYAIDLPFGLEIIEQSIKACDNYKQIVIGSKYQRNSKTKIILKRYLASKLYNLALNLLFKLNVKDSQGSLLFSNAEIKKVFLYLDSDTPFLQTQILIYLKLLGNTIKEIPVEYLTCRKGSKIRLLRDGSRMMSELFSEVQKFRRVKKQFAY